MAKILVFGITGSLGLHFADAAKELGLTLHVFLRPATANDPEKAKKFDGCVIHQGDILDLESVNKAMQGIDAVVSLLGGAQIKDQIPLIHAAAAAGVKRFIPSEFSCCLNDEKSVEAHGHAKKMAVRHALRESGIEWTCIQSCGFMQWFGPACFNMLGPEYPKSVEVYDGGDSKIGMTNLMDIARVALRAVQDPRCANKFIMISFPGTLFTQNEMVDLWEKVSGEKVERILVDREGVKQKMELAYQDPAKELEAITYHVVWGYIVLRLGNCAHREGELLAAELYPEIKPITLEEFYRGIVAKHQA
eukprot:c25919_g1_i1.p1 GENE.c25919_g1_i1~~c25919_g1_i1.p1  ORF type:complete len:323 (+),score=89.35 c25919_g1_i1:55-969(+)